MAFSPRTFQEILTEMIAYVQSRTLISDFSVGSVVRTMLEAAALEDDEQYFQMVQLLDLFSIATASGEDLDRRLAEYNITREPAKPAFGKVRFYTNNLVSDQVALDAVSGGNQVKMFDSTGFPTNSFPYTVRIGEGTARVQDRSVIAINTASNTLTLSGASLLVSDIIVGDRVSLLTGSTAHVVNAGTSIQAPPSQASGAKIYTTQEPAFIAAGNYYSNEVLAKASQAGVGSNAGTTRVSRFVGSPPFQGAGVTNTTAMGGGRARQSDQDFRADGLTKIQSLSRGTPLALRSHSVGVEDPATGQRVLSSNLLEDFVADEVTVYIDDGTGLDPDVVALPSSSLNGAASPGAAALTLSDGSDFPSSGTILIGTSELVEYDGKSTADILALTSTLVSAHGDGTIVRFVDVISSSTETGQRRFSVQNFPVVRGTERVFMKEPLAASWTELARGSEFLLNRGTGEFSIVDVSGLSEGTYVVSHYNYYTNLVAEVQKTLEGASSDSSSYPGVKAAGIFLSVEAPVIRRVTVRASISAEASFVESDLAPLVRRSIETYISSLKIGQDVIRSKIIDAAHNVVGVRDVVVVLPAANVVVLENELPVPYNSSGETLVTVL